MTKLGSETFSESTDVNSLLGNVPTNTAAIAVLDVRQVRLNPATVAIAAADTTLVVGDVVTTAENSTGSGGGASYTMVVDTSVTVDSVDVIQAANGLALVKRIENRNGGAFIIYDDGTAATKDELMPISVANDFKTGLAMFHSGMASSYTFVTLSDALTFRQTVTGEILSHSMNSVVLDASLDLTYGNSLLRTAATEFSQFGFEPRGFVAPNSTLDDKFRTQLKQSYDYAFIRSVSSGSGTAAINRFGEDKYNLVRVLLQSLTLEQAKDIVDLARKLEAFVCFYTHIDVGYLPALMTYITDTYRNINPSEWIGDNYGLGRDIAIKSTGNLLVNSEFSLINADDTVPAGWSFVPGTLASPTLSIIDNEGGALIDMDVLTSTAGDSGTFSQNYFFSQLTELTPFCFSVYARSLAISNIQVKMAIFAKDAGNTTISSVSRVYDIAANRQKIEIQQAFIPDATVDHILVEMTFTAIGTGGVRCLFDSPKLERAGFPTPYSSTRNSRYYSVLRRVTGLSVTPNTDTLVSFDAELLGTNALFNLTTGEAKPADDRNYLLQCNFGLSAMDAGDIIEYHLLIDGVVSQKVKFSAVAGTNIFNPSWTIRSGGGTYAVGIRHNNAAGKSLTTFSDATMTVTSSKG